MRGPGGDDEPELQVVLDALEDPGCRTIVTHLDEPMTARNHRGVINVLGHNPVPVAFSDPRHNT